MIDKGKKIKTNNTATPQVVLLFSQFLFITALFGGFSLMTRASFTVYERSLSPLYVEGGVSFLFD